METSDVLHAPINVVTDDTSEEHGDSASISVEQAMFLIVNLRTRLENLYMMRKTDEQGVDPKVEVNVGKEIRDDRAL